jgi:hypothetical protein
LIIDWLLSNIHELRMVCLRFRSEFACPTWLKWNPLVLCSAVTSIIFPEPLGSSVVFAVTFKVSIGHFVMPKLLEFVTYNLLFIWFLSIWIFCNSFPCKHFSIIPNHVSRLRFWRTKIIYCQILFLSLQICFHPQCTQLHKPSAQSGFKWTDSGLGNTFNFFPCLTNGLWHVSLT